MIRRIEDIKVGDKVEVVALFKGDCCYSPYMDKFLNRPGVVRDIDAEENDVCIDFDDNTCDWFTLFSIRKIDEPIIKIRELVVGKKYKIIMENIKFYGYSYIGIPEYVKYESFINDNNMYDGVIEIGSTLTLVNITIINEKINDIILHCVTMGGIDVVIPYTCVDLWEPSYKQRKMVYEL